jgi:hypothetical protein
MQAQLGGGYIATQQYKEAVSQQNAPTGLLPRNSRDPLSRRHHKKFEERNVTSI